MEYPQGLANTLFIIVMLSKFEKICVYHKHYIVEMHFRFKYKRISIFSLWKYLYLCLGWVFFFKSVIYHQFKCLLTLGSESAFSRYHFSA